MKFASHWAYYPRSYTVHPVPSGQHGFEINGDLTKDVWQNAATWSAPFADIQGKDGPSEPTPALTQFKALYDDTHLYIGALIYPSPDVPATEAHFTHRNDPIFQKDSDFEVFIDVTGCNHNYKELEINAINTVWNLLLDKPYRDGGGEHSGRIAKPGDPMYYDARSQKTGVRVLEGNLNDSAKGQALWSVELALAFEDLYVTIPETEKGGDSLTPPDPPKPGDFWRINFSRVEKRGDINWTWQPQIVWDPEAREFKGIIDMHAPDTFGYFRFVGNSDDADTKYPERDPTWPLRLTAMHIYHAQRAFHERNNEQYASTMKDLESLVDKTIVEPFEIHLFTKGKTYTALVRSAGDTKVASVSHDRLLILQEWDLNIHSSED
uniref:Carbohydrate-binding domain-containing protein n=1 Tax=Amphora coffeiformis TaxID=265554 RepID=A0A7S3L6W0_9STRA|mmetsp:Transcript_13950/g.26739  ORF Transcript_13950/g.26739 Transcript_13950/m.26739 type:complete len:379 (-) Transcript_13950:319-1455(-)